MCSRLPSILLLFTFLLMINTFIEKCSCCDERILFIRGNHIKSDLDSSDLIPVADLSQNDLRILLEQIVENLP